MNSPGYDIETGVRWRIFAFLPALSCVLAQTYVGSRACATCHADIYKSFSRSAMGRSMSLPSGLTLEQPATVYNAKLDRYFGVFRRDGNWYQSEYALEGQTRTFENTQKIDFVMGTGENGWSFLVRRGESLVEAPLSFYAKPKKWDLSPGFEAEDVGFNRPIQEACIACHSGRANSVRGRNGVYGSPTFHELAVGCENCHGPGGDHMKGNRHAIVNPGALEPRLAEDICMNCHQAGNARILQPGKTYSDFRPGMPLRETLAIFKLPQTGEADLLEHNAAMKASKCFRESNGKLSCLTCHDVHAQIEVAQKSEFYRARCLTCHNNQSCKLPLAKRVSNRGNDCAGCHMPKRANTQIAHSALTNHRIIARPDEPPSSSDAIERFADLPGIVYVNGPRGQTDSRLPLLTRLTAYGELSAQQPQLEAQYWKLLQQAETALPQEPLVRAALGRKALRDQHYQEAIRLLTGATAAASVLDLTKALKLAGKEAESAPVLEHAVTLNPLDKTLRKTLILIYIDLKQYNTAKAAMQDYLAAFPEDSFMRGLLRKIDSGR
ncbi:MAG TPA: multiheme c-type cytochrome [Bryobacteraceae bacterium]